MRDHRPIDESPWKVVFVENDDAGRLDGRLSRMIDGMSRKKAAQWIAAGLVTVNGRPQAKSLSLRKGDTVEIWCSPLPADWTPGPDTSCAIEILYRDDDIVVVEKRSGISSVPHSAQELGTLANFAVAEFPQCAAVGKRKGDGGLLQRLDRLTSGLVMIALSQEVHDRLSAAQKRGEIEKCYLALAGGPLPKQCSIDTPLIKSGKKGERVRPASTGMPARTEVRRVESFGHLHLLEAVIRHGVRHQIRAHLASIGCPIAGDPLYGDARGPEMLKRLFLHAHRITFAHPTTGIETTVVSKLPVELEAVLQSLRSVCVE